MQKKSWSILCKTIAGLAVLASVVASDAAAQNYPVKPIRIVSGFPAGSGADFVARTVGTKLAEQLGQPVVIENLSGASGTIATEKVATSATDGYTLLMVTAAETSQPALRNRLPYNFERDFAPISLIAIGTFAIAVHPSVPVHNIKDLVALARSQPGKLNYASSGRGSSPHLAASLLEMMTKIRLTEIPYKGSTAAITATVSGEVDFSFPSITVALPLLRTNRIKALAVTGSTRAPLLPSVPTVSESALPGYERSTWHGLVAPKGTPVNIEQQLNLLANKIVATPETKALLERQGLEPQVRSPQQFAALIHDSISKNTMLIRAATTGSK